VQLAVMFLDDQTPQPQTSRRAEFFFTLVEY